MSGSYKKLLLFWAILFALSSAVIFINMRALQQYDREASRPDKPDAVPEEGDQPTGSSQILTIVFAAVTAVASGGGFIATTLFALRSDRRQSTLYQLQIENLQKEIVHKELEIERMRREAKSHSEEE